MLFASTLSFPRKWNQRNRKAVKTPQSSCMGPEVEKLPIWRFPLEQLFKQDVRRSLNILGLITWGRSTWFWDSSKMSFGGGETLVSSCSYDPIQVNSAKAHFLRWPKKEKMTGVNQFVVFSAPKPLDPYSQVSMSRAAAPPTPSVCNSRDQRGQRIYQMTSHAWDMWDPRWARCQSLQYQRGCPVKVGTMNGDIARKNEPNTSDLKKPLTHMINGMVFALVFEHEDLIFKFSW